MHARHKNAKHRRHNGGRRGHITPSFLFCKRSNANRDGAVQTSPCLHLTPEVCRNTHLQCPHTPPFSHAPFVHFAKRRESRLFFSFGKVRTCVLEMSIAIRKPKNARAKRAMLAREPKMVEGDRAALWMRGTTVGQQFIAPSSAYHMHVCLF